MGDYTTWVTETLAVSFTIGLVTVSLGYLFVAATVVGGILSWVAKKGKVR